MSVPFQVIPYEKLEYEEDPFMKMVDQLDPKSDAGPNIYLCFFSLKTKGFIGYSPRESVWLKAFADKENIKDRTEERTIQIGETTIYYFLKLLGINNFLSDSSDSKNMNDGNSAKSRYGKIYDAILDSYSKNNCCIIYASDIDSADKLFKEAVKKGTITLTSEYITKKDDNIEQKYRWKIDRDIKAKKEEKAKQEAINAAEENKKEGKKRSEVITEAIASIPEMVDLRWQVFTLHDIGDTIVSENKVLPKFSKPVSDWDPTNPTPPININSSDYKKGIPSNDTVAAIPKDFSWVTTVNESKSIHVIKVKPIYRPSDLAKSPKYTILGQEDFSKKGEPNIKSQSYEVTIEKLKLSEQRHSDELEFKKRMIIPFIGDYANSGEKYFVLNAEDEIAGKTEVVAAGTDVDAGDAEVVAAGTDVDAGEIKVLRYFLRKYGICYVESPVDKKYIFKFTHDDYINIEINATPQYKFTPTNLTFGNTPPTGFGIFYAIPFVLRCLKNDKLLMKQIDNVDSTLTPPEVLVLSQLTKDKINSATSVYFVVEQNTEHRKKHAAGRGFVLDYFGDIDGFTEPVVMHKKKWLLGCVQSILDEPDCTTYNELTLLTTGKTPYDSYDIDRYKEYLLNGKFPDDFSLVTRGDDDYCKFVALEPYGNVFHKKWMHCEKHKQCFDWVISKPGLGLEKEQHPVFYIFNAANKASAVNAFNAKLEEEMKKVILVEDGKNVVNKANLDSNPFLKTFNSYNYTGRLDIDSITPFVKSITAPDEPPKIDVLIPENIQLEYVEPVYTSNASFSRSEYLPIRDMDEQTSLNVPIGNGRGGKSNKKRTKKSRRNKVRSNKRNVRSNKRTTRSNKRKYNNTRKK
jgi:hypothetical protein